jgi:hypothetical protein
MSMNLQLNVIQSSRNNQKRSKKNQRQDPWLPFLDQRRESQIYAETPRSKIGTRRSVLNEIGHTGTLDLEMNQEEKWRNTLGWDRLRHGWGVDREVTAPIGRRLAFRRGSGDKMEEASPVRKQTPVVGHRGPGGGGDAPGSPSARG